MLTGAPLLTAAAGDTNFTAYAPLLVPIATIIVGILSLIGVRRAARVEDTQGKAKTRLDERVHALDEMSKLVERLEAENARLRVSRDDEAARVRADAEHEGSAHRAAETRCQKRTEQLLHELDTLRSIVTSEIAKAAATGAALDAAHHVEDHDTHLSDATD